jgi:hypothetical protein
MGRIVSEARAGRDHANRAIARLSQDAGGLEESHTPMTRRVTNRALGMLAEGQDTGEKDASPGARGGMPNLAANPRKSWP